MASCRRRPGFPRPSDRCRGLAAEDHTQGWAPAPIAMATRSQGAPLTVILRGDRMPGTEDGARPVLQARSSTQRNGGLHRPAGARQPTWRRRRARQGYRPKGRDMAAAPGVGRWPTAPHRSWWCPSLARIRTRCLRVPACVWATCPAVACRRRALDDCEENPHSYVSARLCMSLQATSLQAVDCSCVQQSQPQNGQLPYLRQRFGDD